jgi:hypothetical protein
VQEFHIHTVRRQEELASRLLEMAVELHPSLSVQSVKGDGNCLYRSISVCIHGNDDLHEHIRIEILDEVQRRVEFYKGFKPDINAWIENQRKLGSWGEDLSLHAAANVYGPIAVFRKHSDQKPTMFVPNRECLQELPITAIEFDETHGRGCEHYSPLLLTATSTSPSTSSAISALVSDESTQKPPKLRRMNGIENLDERFDRIFTPNGSLRDDPAPTPVALAQTAPSPLPCTNGVVSPAATAASPTSAATAAPPPERSEGSFGAKFDVTRDVLGNLIKGDELLYCRKCESPAQVNKQRMSKKASAYIVCNACNTKSAQLHKAFGTWPTNAVWHMANK